MSDEITSRPPKALAKLEEQSNDYENVNRLERLAKAQGLGESENMGGIKRQVQGIKGLCATCAHATIITRGDVEHRDTTIKCSMIGEYMPHDISECSDYWKRGQMSLREMQEIAWFIDGREPLPGGGYR